MESRSMPNFTNAICTRGSLRPISGTRSTRRASVAGRVYARTTQRYAMLGMELVKIAGSTPFRHGALLTA